MAHEHATTSTHAHDHAADHGPGGHAFEIASAGHERRLMLVLALTSLYTIAEVVGGLLTGSLALVADAGHLFTDVLGLAMAVAAIRFARRPATATKTYGFYRTEVLAALVNGVALFVVAASIFLEAAQRLRNPETVQALPMLVVACGGVVVTLISVSLLHAGARESLNVRGAFLEVLGDLLGAAGTVIAAVLILTLGWQLADPIMSALIALLILPRGWGLLKSVVDVLLEAAPSNVNLAGLDRAMRAVPGVASVHDLHVWTITSGFVAMSAHVLSNGRPSEAVLHDVRSMLRDRFEIEHMTLQVESLDHVDDGACCVVDPRCLVLGEAATLADAAFGREPVTSGAAPTRT